MNFPVKPADTPGTHFLRFTQKAPMIFVCYAEPKQHRNAFRQQPGICMQDRYYK